MKTCNGFAFKDESIFLTQYVFSSCGMTHVIFGLKKVGTTFQLQKENFKERIETWRCLCWYMEK